MWMRERLGTPGLLAIFLLLIGHPAHSEPTFVRIGLLPPGPTYDEPRSFPTGISADGSTVVGNSIDGAGRSTAYRWTRDEGITSFGEIPGGSPGERAREALDVSDDGSRVLIKSSTWRFYLWDREDGFISLENVAEGLRFIRANDLSADGSTVAGLLPVPFSFEKEAGIWSAENGFSRLGKFPDGGQSTATRVFADGSTVLGSGRHNGIGSEPFLWTREDGIVGLSDLSGGRVNGFAELLSADESTVVGAYFGESGEVSFTWTPEDGMVELGQPVGGPTSVRVFDLSSDGSTVAGASNLEAFVWT